VTVSECRVFYCKSNSRTLSPKWYG